MTAETISEMAILIRIDDLRRSVMDLYGGNLDHPALAALEHAAWEIRNVSSMMALRP